LLGAFLKAGIKEFEFSIKSLPKLIFFKEKYKSKKVKRIKL